MRHAAVLLLLSSSLVQGQEETQARYFSATEPFVPTHPDVIFVSDLALDIEAMFDDLKKVNADSMEAAWNIYVHGGYAKTSATLTLQKPLEWAITEGEILKGMAQNKKNIPLIAAADYRNNDKIQVIYTQNVATCHVGGLPDDLRDTDGCLISPGFLHVGNHQTPIEYTYTVDGGNFNALTVARTSMDAQRLYKIMQNEENTYYEFFQKYMDYYAGFDPASFAHQINTAIKDGTKFEWWQGVNSFDFSNVTLSTRAEYFESMSAYLIIGLDVIRSMEEAVMACNGICFFGDCRTEALNSVDMAVAYYTGATQAKDGEGNLFFSFANSMCKLFKTCGENGDDFRGTAKVNLDVFDLFNDLRESIEQKTCQKAKDAKDKITSLMNVPFIQGFFLSTYKLNNPDSFDHVKQDAAPMAAAVFPLLKSCQYDDVWGIELKFDPSDKKLRDAFNKVTKILPDYYPCADVCCFDIGGLYDQDTNMYFRNQEPCIDTSNECLAKAGKLTDSSSDKKAAKVVMVLLVVLALAILICLYRRRKRRFPSSRRANTVRNEHHEFA